MTNDFSSSSTRGLNSASSKLSQIFAKLASGSRINKASDDPAGLAVSASLDAVATTLSQGSRNVSDTQSALDVADSALGQISDITSRLQELATQSANGTLSDDQRASLQAEYSSLTQEVQRISQTTQFNGKNVLQGDSISTQVGTGSDPNSQVNFSGVDVSNLVSSVAGGDISTQAGAQAALDNVQSFASNITATRGNIGAVSSRLDVAQKNNDVGHDEAVAASSRIRDVDVADETSNLVAAKIRQQTSVALAAQANQNATIVRQLLS